MSEEAVSILKEKKVRKKVKKDSIIDARAEEVTNYTPEKVVW